MRPLLGRLLLVCLLGAAGGGWAAPAPRPTQANICGVFMGQYAVGMVQMRGQAIPGPETTVLLSNPECPERSILLRLPRRDRDANLARLWTALFEPRATAPVEVAVTGRLYFDRADPGRDAGHVTWMLDVTSVDHIFDR